MAISGVGVIRDYSGAPSTFLATYENAAGVAGKTPWTFHQKPDAVIINLGTNDIDNGKGDPGKAFDDAYLRFLEKLRTRYPGAFVFLTIGPMLGAAELATMRNHLTTIVAARAKAGDTKVATFDYGIRPARRQRRDSHRLRLAPERHRACCHGRHAEGPASSQARLVALARGPS